VRQLHALVLLAEEMNFTRAANRLNVSQPALSKLVTELEEQYGLHLFNREKGRLIELTDAGQIFIEEARAALSHAERAIQLARAAQEGIERILMVGHSPHCDQAWIALFYPKHLGFTITDQKANMTGRSEATALASPIQQIAKPSTH
jgi:DNA-binding transcriptional LysR family regulator